MKKRIFVAGHRGMVGSAIVKQLASDANHEIILRTRDELDLCCQSAVHDFFTHHGIDEVYLAAAKVGGILANDNYPADFMYENLMIECNVIRGAFEAGIRKLLFLGSSCIYPRMASQPIQENELMSGPLEPTNEPYAIAKIAGIKLCESYNRQHSTDYRSAMPTNLYGPGDNFHPENSHVIPGLIRRFHEAKMAGTDTVKIWGSGKALREFLHVEDMASAAVHIMNLSKNEYQNLTSIRISHLNVGSGIDCSIAELAETIRDITGFKGRLEYDTSKPDGTPRKIMDSSKLQSTGWHPLYSLRKGLEHTYAWYVNNAAQY